MSNEEAGGNKGRADRDDEGRVAGGSKTIGPLTIEWWQGASRDGGPTVSVEFSIDGVTKLRALMEPASDTDLTDTQRFAVRGPSGSASGVVEARFPSEGQQGTLAAHGNYNHRGQAQSFDEQLGNLI